MLQPAVPPGGGGGAVNSVTAGTGLSDSGTPTDPILNVNLGAGLLFSGDTVVVSFGPATTLVAGGSAVDGVSPSVAHADHIHALPIAAPVTVSGTANSAGSSTSVAAADHQHALGAHAATHQNSGTDELNVGGLNGVLVEAQPVAYQSNGVALPSAPHTTTNLVGASVHGKNAGGGVAEFASDAISTIEKERLFGRRVKQIDSTTNPNLLNANLSDATYAFGCVWFTSAGNGAAPNNISRIFVFDAITKEEKSFSPINLLNPVSATGNFFVRAIVSDGQRYLWACGNPSGGAFSYLWRIDPFTGAQTIFDLTNEPENAPLRGYQIWNYGASANVNGLDVTINLFGVVQSQTITMVGIDPISVDDAVTYLNSQITIGCEARRYDNPVTGSPEILFLADAAHSGILVSGTAITAVGGISSYTFASNRGTATRCIDFDPRNRNLWMWDPIQKGAPIVWNIDSQSVVSVIEDVLLNFGSLDNPYQAVICGKYAIQGARNYGTLFRWNVDTISAVGITETAWNPVAFQADQAGIISDGQFVYTPYYKYDPEANVVVSIDNDPPSYTGSLAVTKDSVFVFERSASAFVASHIRRLDKKNFKTTAIRLIPDTAAGLSNFSVRTFRCNVPFDGAHLWGYQSTNGSSPVIFQYTVEEGAEEVRVRKGNLSSVENRLHDMPMSVDRLKTEENDYIGQFHKTYSTTVGFKVNAPTALMAADLCYLSTMHTGRDVDVTHNRYKNVVLGMYHMMDGRSSQHDTIDNLGSFFNQDGNGEFYNVLNGTGRHDALIKGFDSGQGNEIAKFMDSITAMAPDGNGNIWFCSDGGSAGNASHVVCYNPNDGRIVFQDSFSDAPGGLGTNTRKWRKIVVFDNIVDTAPSGFYLNSTYYSYVFVMSAGTSRRLIGYRLNKITNTVDFADINDLPNYHYGVAMHISQNGASITGEPYSVAISPLGHSATTTLQDVDKINEWMVISDQQHVYLYNMMNTIDQGRTTYLSIPTTNAKLVHVNQRSIFVADGADIKEFQFNPNRLMWDRYCNVNTGTQQVTFSQPLPASAKVGDIVYISDVSPVGDTRSTHFIQSIDQRSPVGIVTVAGGDGALSVATGANNQTVELYSFKEILFNSGFNNIVAMNSHGKYLYVVDGNTTPYSDTTPTTLYKFELSTAVEDTDWTAAHDISTMCGYFRDGSVDFLSAHTSGETVTVTCDNAGLSGTVRVYGTDAADTAAQYEDFAFVGTTPVVGASVFARVFGAKIISISPVLLPTGASILIQSSTTLNTISDIGNAAGGQFGGLAFNRYPFAGANQETRGVLCFADQSGGTFNIYVKGTDIGGTVRQELLSIVGGAETHSVYAYKDIEFIGNPEGGSLTLYKINRPTRITDMLIDGNHLVLLDQNNEQILKRAL